MGWGTSESLELGILKMGLLKRENVLFGHATNGSDVLKYYLL